MHALLPSNRLLPPSLHPFLVTLPVGFALLCYLADLAMIQIAQKTVLYQSTLSMAYYFLATITAVSTVTLGLLIHLAPPCQRLCFRIMGLRPNLVDNETLIATVLAFGWKYNVFLLGGLVARYAESQGPWAGKTMDELAALYGIVVAALHVPIFLSWIVTVAAFVFARAVSLTLSLGLNFLASMSNTRRLPSFFHWGVEGVALLLVAALAWLGELPGRTMRAMAVQNPRRESWIDRLCIGCAVLMGCQAVLLMAFEMTKPYLVEMASALLQMLKAKFWALLDVSWALAKGLGTWLGVQVVSFLVFVKTTLQSRGGTRPRQRPKPSRTVRRMSRG